MTNYWSNHSTFQEPVTERGEQETKSNRGQGQRPFVMGRPTHCCVLVLVVTLLHLITWSTLNNEHLGLGDNAAWCAGVNTFWSYKRQCVGCVDLPLAMHRPRTEFKFHITSVPSCRRNCPSKTGYWHNKSVHAWSHFNCDCRKEGESIIVLNRN